MNTILQGDCREVLKTLDAASVHCCVTSPPYWGLRDYGTAEWEGGSEDCDHKRIGNRNERPRSGLQGGTETVNHAQEPQYRDQCGKCGATRIDKQLGLEKTPDEYVAKLVEVFREVRRVLRDDGTLWLNLGSSYAGSWGNYHPNSPPGKHGQRLKETARWNRPAYDSQEFLPPTANLKGFKPKDLVPIPWMVGMALQQDGWWLRQDIIWSKPSPMPESVTDRCTKSHEYILLLSKSERYFYNAEAIMEEAGNWHASIPGRNGGPGQDRRSNLERESVKRGDFNGKTNELAGREAFRAVTPERNKRSVWTVTTKPYREAHFATFPPDLILPCILAGCPEGGTVLDPFLGSGTTAMVAQKNGCDCIGIELNPEYVELAKRRIEQRSIFV